MRQIANKWIEERSNRIASVIAFNQRPAPTLFEVGTIIYVRDEDKLLRAIFHDYPVRRQKQQRRRV